MSGKRTDLQRAQDAIRDKIAVLQAALNELASVEQAKKARRPRAAKPSTPGKTEDPGR